VEFLREEIQNSREKRTRFFLVSGAYCEDLEKLRDWHPRQEKTLSSSLDYSGSLREEIPQSNAKIN